MRARSPVLLALAFLALLLLCAACGKEKKQTTRALYQLVDARVHYIRGDYARAEAMYEHYLRMAPDGEYSWEAWQRRVFIWMTVNNNSTQAAELLREMAVEYSDNPALLPGILHLLATAHENAGEQADAIATWREYVQLDNLDAVNATIAYHHMARLEQERRGYDLALQDLDKCIAVAATGQDRQSRIQQLGCQYEKARTKLLQQRLDEALGLLESLTREPDMDPELNATAGYVLAELYRTQNSPDKALAVLKAIQDSYPNVAVVRNRLEKIEKSKK